MHFLIFLISLSCTLFFLKKKENQEDIKVHSTALFIQIWTSFSLCQHTHKTKQKDTLKVYILRHFNWQQSSLAFSHIAFCKETPKLKKYIKISLEMKRKAFVPTRVIVSHQCLE